jgi:hypothetical protein
MGHTALTQPVSRELSARVFSQSKFIEAHLKSGYPLHSPAEFRAWIEAAGLQVLEVEGAYRDPSTGEPMSDLVVARRPMV